MIMIIETEAQKNTIAIMAAILFSRPEWSQQTTAAEDAVNLYAEVLDTIERSNKNNTGM